jgi:arylsulfatase A-like enzyme
LSIGPTLFGRAAEQKDHEYLYWEFMGWTAVRQGNWRVVKPARATAWELYDLSADPGETKDLAAANPALVAKLTAFAAIAHAPAQEGTFTSTERHERDRRAKFGKQDDPSYAATPSGTKKKKK